MPNNLPIETFKPNNLSVNNNLSNRTFVVTIQTGQSMGLLLALTYPITFTEIYP